MLDKGGKDHREVRKLRTKVSSKKGTGIEQLLLPYCQQNSVGRCW